MVAHVQGRWQDALALIRRALCCSEQEERWFHYAHALIGAAAQMPSDDSDTVLSRSAKVLAHLIRRYPDGTHADEARELLKDLPRGGPHEDLLEPIGPSISSPSAEVLLTS